MKKLTYLKLSFIPSRWNEYHPYMIRTPALATVASVMIFMQVVIMVAGPSSAIHGLQAGIDEGSLVELTNEARQEAEAAPLAVNPALQQAATDKAEDMIARNYWSHYAPDGTSPWSFIRESGYDYRYAGENLAKSFRTDEGVVRGWLQSETHRENMLDERFSEIGIATASGELNGENTTVVVAMYARPQSVGMQLGETPESGVASASETAPDTEENYSLLNPMMSLAVVPVATQAAVVISIGLAAIYALQHIAIRGRHLLWDEHIHPRPLLQTAVLLGMAVLLLQTGLGVVG